MALVFLDSGAESSVPRFLRKKIRNNRKIKAKR